MENRIEDFFKNNRSEFNFEEPDMGHFERFQAKLKGEVKEVS